MKYDFTTLPDRHGRDSIAVDGLGKGFAPDAPQPGFDAIPMWVADMNFVCLPTIQQAVIERVQHPAFGYFDPTPEYYGSIIRWQETRNDVTGLTAEHRLRERRAGRRHQRTELRLLPGRQGAGPQPHLHRLHPLPDRQRL